MTDLTAAERQWHDWIRDACAAVDVDAGAVDVTGIHALTKEIAHGFARPMAPVGSYILGPGRRGAGRPRRSRRRRRRSPRRSAPPSPVESREHAACRRRHAACSLLSTRAAGQKVMPRAANRALTSAAAAAPWFARALA